MMVVHFIVLRGILVLVLVLLFFVIYTPAPRFLTGPRARGPRGARWKTMSSKNDRIWQTYATSSEPAKTAGTDCEIALHDFLIASDLSKIAA